MYHLPETGYFRLPQIIGNPLWMVFTHAVGSASVAPILALTFPREDVRQEHGAIPPREAHAPAVACREHHGDARSLGVTATLKAPLHGPLPRFAPHLALTASGRLDEQAR